MGRGPAVVVSQPSRPRGRRSQVVDPPVIASATREGLDTLQPETVSEAGFLERIRALEPAVAIVVAFGQIFKKDLLALPTKGCINLHASLLPRFRGAAPVQAAIVAGERSTGVTTMLMDEGLDSGDILLQRQVDIGEQETAPDLGRRLSNIGAELVLETLNRIERGDLVAKPQDPSDATYAPRLKREDGRISWKRPAGAIFDQIRGLLPWPGCWSLLRDEPVKILWGRVAERAHLGPREPGTVLGLEDEGLFVACGEATGLFIERLQRPGRQAVEAKAFANGERLAVGERFG